MYSTFFKFGKLKPLHQVFFDLVHLSSKQVFVSSSFNNGSLNNSLNVSNQNNSNNLSISINNNNTNNSKLTYMKLEEFCPIVINSVSYCICPGLNHELFNYINPKPISLVKPLKDKHNHPEGAELPPLDDTKKYSLVLDMDETLIHFFDVS